MPSANFTPTKTSWPRAGPHKRLISSPCTRHWAAVGNRSNSHDSGRRRTHEFTVFRLPISEVTHAPEVARALDSIARERSRGALRKIMARAQASGLLTGRPAELAKQFAGLLWRDLQVSLLLGVAERPNPREISKRARDAAAAFLQLHPLPNHTAAV